MPLQIFQASVRSVRDLTHDVREIDLGLADPGRINFKAGQFVSFEIVPPGSARPVIRPYSLASPPSRSDAVTLLFNLVPNGPGSTYLFSLRSGDRVTFKGTAGTFYLRDDLSRDHLFVATGTGIAPIRSMLFDLFERGCDRSIRLLWGLRSRQDLYYQDELAELTSIHPNFTFITTLSQPEDGWSGHIGRVTPLVEADSYSINNLVVYLCGNSGMIRDVTGIIHAKGLCPIYREKYYDD